MRPSKCRIGSQSVHRGEAYLAYLAFLAQIFPNLPRIGQGWLPADLD